MENIYEYFNGLSCNREAGGFVDQLYNCERGKKYFCPEDGGNVFSQMLISSYKITRYYSSKHCSTHTHCLANTETSLLKNIMHYVIGKLEFKHPPLPAVCILTL